MKLLAALVLILCCAGCMSPDIGVLDLNSGKMRHPSCRGFRQVVVSVDRNAGTFTTLTREGSNLVMRSFDKTCKRVAEQDLRLFTRRYCGKSFYAVSSDLKRLAYADGRPADLTLLDMSSGKEVVLQQNFADSWGVMPFLKWIDGSTLPPDVARVSFQIKAFDEVSTNVLAVIESRSFETLVILATNGVKKDDIVGFEVEKDVVNNRDKETFKNLQIIGYSMNRRIEFTLRDLSKYDPIISGLLRTPNVSNIKTEFNRTDVTNVEEKLLSDAVADARHKANLIAKGTQQRIKSVKAVSQQGFYNLGEAFGVGNQKFGQVSYSVGDQPSRELLFIPATVEFTSCVFLLYEVEEAK